MRSISGPERGTIDSILMESPPFLKSGSRPLVGLFSIPNQHVGVVIDPNFFAVRFNDFCWLIEKVICVHNSDADFVITQFAMLASQSGSDLPLFAKEVEDSAKLIISSLRRHEVIEASHLVQGIDGAAPVGWDAVTRVADQECEVELLQDLCRYDGRISRLCGRAVRIRGFMMTVGDSVGEAISCPVRDPISCTVHLSSRSNSLLGRLSAERWGDGCKLSFRRDEVMCDVLDEETFPLCRVRF